MILMDESHVTTTLPTRLVPSERPRGVTRDSELIAMRESEVAGLRAEVKRLRADNESLRQRLEERALVPVRRWPAEAGR